MSRQLILMCGPAGAGKTFIGKSIASRLSATYLDKEVMCEVLVDALLVEKGSDKHDRESEIYASEVKHLEYKSLMSTAFDSMIAGNNTVVCSAPFLSQVTNDDWTQDLIDMSKILGFEIFAVWCHTDGNTSKERIIARNNPRDNWKLRHWEEYSANAQYSTPHSLLNFFTIDNGIKPKEALISQMTRFLDMVQKASA